MRIGVILTLGFLLIASFVALVGYLYKVTSDTVQIEISKLRRSSIDQVVGAAEMRLALQSGQIAAQQIITARLQVLVQPDHETGPLPGLDDSIDDAEDSLAEFERRLQQSRLASTAAGEFERLPSPGGEAIGHRAPAEWLQELDKQYAVYKTQMDRFIHLSLYHPTEEVAEYFIDELQDHYEDELLPLIRTYGEVAETALGAELGTMETVHRAANRRNLVVTVAAFVSAVLLGLLIARSISRPVAILQEAAGRVGKGELDTRVDLQTRNEIGKLARAFNKMVGDLEASTVSRSYLDNIIQSMSEMLIVTNPRGLIRTANRMTYEELGFEEEDLFGEDVEVILDGIELAELDTGEHCFRTKTGEPVPVYCSRSELITEDGTLEGVVLLALNLSARKETEAQLRASLAEKEVLLREVHHRVKNNLQIVSSLLSLQNARDQPITETQRALVASQNRIRSMALIHEQLYKSKDLARIDFAQYARDLTQYLARSYDIDRQRIELQLEIEPIPLSVEQAIPCGMIVNELVANGVEHAFSEEGGKIRIAFSRQGKRCQLTVGDDGHGLPDAVDPSQATTLGLRLVWALGEQLNAEVGFSRNGGTRVTVEFEIAEPAAPEAVST